MKSDNAKVSDLFIVTAVVAAFAAQVLLGFIALCCTLLAVWYRPLVFRFWASGMTGVGTGMFLAGVYDLQGLNLQRAELVGWGGGIVIGTITCIILFMGPLAIPVVTKEPQKME